MPRHLGLGRFLGLLLIRLSSSSPVSSVVVEVAAVCVVSLSWSAVSSLATKKNTIDRDDDAREGNQGWDLPVLHRGESR